MCHCPCTCAMAALYFYACFILKLTLVAGQPVHYVLKEREVVLSPVLPSAPDDILWKHNGDKVITFDSAGQHVFPPYEGRVSLGRSTAELTISDVGYEDSGEYELYALIRDRQHHSQYILKVLDKVSKPVVRCEVNDESSNSTSVRRATLLCYSESNTPETLTFKWDLDGKSHLGHSLSIGLEHEHDHMEYRCTATNPLHAETSVFMAKDCYTERSSEALDIVVPIVIASLILLVVCILTFIFRHQIKRACLKQRNNNDLEKQITETDDKSKDEGSPLMRDIHRQEMFASKQPLIQQKEYETPQRQETTKDMEKLKSEGKVKKVLDIFIREHTESHSHTETEEENETGISELATSQPASPIKNGQVDSESDAESYHVFQSEGRNRSDSHHSSRFYEISEHPESQSPSPGSDPQGLQTKTQEHESDLHHFSHEAVPEKHTADDSSSINTDQHQTTKASEEKDSPVQLPQQGDGSGLNSDSQTETVKPESNKETEPDDKSSPATEPSDQQTDVSQNNSETSEHKATGESELSTDSQTSPHSKPQGLLQSLSIGLENKHDHMEYKCTAANPLDRETSVLMAKECYTDPPGSPKNLHHTDAEKTEVWLEWERPERTGGSDITGFIVEHQEDGQTDWVTFKTVSHEKAHVTGLEEGKTYRFQVKAQNAIGVSRPDTSVPVTCQEKTLPPTIEVDVKFIEGVVVKAGSVIKLQAQMTGIPTPTAKWSSDGKDMTTEGRVTVETIGANTQLTIIEAQRGDTGDYVLSVANPAGSKTVALHVTVLDLPGPPIGPINILKVTPDYMIVQWRPPKDDGGTRITNYIVEKKDIKKPWELWSVVSSGATATKARVSRLEKGHEYIIRVRAENRIGIGQGLESAPTMPKHILNPPGSPGFTKCSNITENAVTVEWPLPNYKGGSPTISYVIERRVMAGKWIRVNKTPVLDLRYRVSGLFEGNSYQFRVFAENIAGISKPSPISDTIKATRAITQPSPPGNPKLKDWSKSYADICWTKPMHDGGSPILGYVVEAQKQGTAQWDHINKDLIKICAYRVPGLIEGMNYRFRIRATNKVGDSEPCELQETVLVKDILVPPEVTVDVSCRDSLAIRAGQIINLITRVKGRPDPEIIWTKDARALGRDKRIEFNNNYPLCELLINDAVLADCGKYTIVAKNSSGQATATVIVNVSSEESLPLSPLQSSPASVQETKEKISPERKPSSMLNDPQRGSDHKNERPDNSNQNTEEATQTVQQTPSGSETTAVDSASHSDQNKNQDSGDKVELNPVAEERLQNSPNEESKEPKQTNATEKTSTGDSEENETGIDEMATSQPASPTRTGQADSNKVSYQMPKSEGRNDSGSDHSSKHSDALEHPEPQSPSPGSDPPALLLKTQEQQTHLYNSNHEAAPKANTADKSSSIHSYQKESTKALEDKDWDSQHEPVKSESKEQTDPDEESASELSDPQTDVSQNRSVTLEPKAELELSSASQMLPLPSEPPESSPPSLLQSSPASDQETKEETSFKIQSHSVHNDPQRDCDHKNERPDNNDENTEDATQTVQQKPSGSETTAVDSASSHLDQNENHNSGDNVQLNPITEERPHKQDSPDEESKEPKQTTDTEKTSTGDSEGPVKESTESTDPPASALSQPSHNEGHRGHSPGYLYLSAPVPYGSSRRGGFISGPLSPGLLASGDPTRTMKPPDNSSRDLLGT